MTEPNETANLPHYPADPLWKNARGFKARTLYESKLVRACDLNLYDVIRLPEKRKWVSLLDVWAGANAGDQAEATYGKDDPSAKFIRNATDWAMDTWVVVRWYDRDNSNEAEIEDALLKLHYFDLIEVQVPTAMQEGRE